MSSIAQMAVIPVNAIAAACRCDSRSGLRDNNCSLDGELFRIRAFDPGIQDTEHWVSNRENGHAFAGLANTPEKS